MEAIFAILGVAMIYSWVHSAIIIGKKIQGTTSYENGLLVFGGVCFALYIFGTL